MVVRTNGVVVRTFPVSTGRTDLPTINGVHVVWWKTPDVIMDSSTVGIPRNSPDGYYEHVAWDVNISSSGEFVHAAPWSVDSQGRANVSHGCVNLAPAAAQWFYYYSLPGDIVQVSGSPRPPSYATATADWNMSWSAWTAGSALPVA
jgi:lipoprotein-anchoring transpeptidase ErfK/SrfK